MKRITSVYYVKGEAEVVRLPAKLLREMLCEKGTTEIEATFIEDDARGDSGDIWKVTGLAPADRRS